MRTVHVGPTRPGVVALGLLLVGLVGAGVARPARALEFAPPAVMACVNPCDETAARCLGAGNGAFCQPRYRLCVERCDPGLVYFETFSRVHPEASTRLNPAASTLTRPEVQRSLCAQACDMDAVTCASYNAVNTPICRNGRLQCIERCRDERAGPPPAAAPAPAAPPPRRARTRR